VTLETARLRLERLAPEHAEALRAIWSDPEVARFLISRPRSPAELDALFARNLEAARKLDGWAVREQASGAVIGRVGFFGFGERERPELAFLLARDAWGRGLATEAARAALGEGFGALAFPEVVALVRPGNAGAIRVLAKLGFASESRLRVRGAPAELYRVDAAGFVETAEPRSLPRGR
jgi:[ribosomal protein S5]-alanine N-acetyltransferase